MNNAILFFKNDLFHTLENKDLEQGSILQNERGIKNDLLNRGLKSLLTFGHPCSRIRFRFLHAHTYIIVVLPAKREYEKRVY